MTRMFYQVVQNKVCPAHVCRADGKGSRLQKLEIWLIYRVSEEHTNAQHKE